MAKREARDFTCDRCGATARLLDPYPTLPEEWLAIEGRVDRAMAFEMDLCSKCATRVLKTITPIT